MDVSEMQSNTCVIHYYLQDLYVIGLIMSEGLHVFLVSDILLRLCDLQRSCYFVSDLYATWIKSWRSVFPLTSLCYAL